MKHVLIPSKLIGDDAFGIRDYYFDYFKDVAPILQVGYENKDYYEYLLRDTKLLILPGGADIDPSRYGAQPTIKIQHQDPIMEYYDRVLLPTALESNVPILGICRGFQSLGVYFGAKLEVDVPEHPHSEFWEERVHMVNRTSVSNLSHSVKVNSLHHQAILEKNLPDCLIPIASHAELCEAFVHKSKKVMGVQWHPEALPKDKWLFDWLNELFK